jgi:hypothetical protein
MGISLAKLIVGKLRLTKEYVGHIIKMQDGQEFTLFRHISIPDSSENKGSVVFIVRFKFARLTYKGNRLASIIPMLLITGYPGFQVKFYAVNHQNAYWQGMYQWKSDLALEEYKRSFVFRLMNKRAIKDSVTYIEVNDHVLARFIESSIVS